MNSPLVLLEKLDTEFGTIKILRSESDGRHTYYQDACFQSQIDSDGVSTCAYVHVMYNIIRQSGARRVLMIGCAGGTLASMLSRLGCEVTVVDINPHAFRLAKRYFKMPETVNCVLQDGWTYMLNTKERYDAVAIDAFGGDATVPRQFISQHAFRLVADVLAPAGLLLMNVLVGQGRETLADRIGQNMKAAGLPVLLFDWLEPSTKTRNVVVTGGLTQEMRIPSGREPGRIKELIRNMRCRMVA